MTDLSFAIPPATLEFLNQQVAEGRYVDAGDYLRDLLRREQEEAKELAWLREQIAEALDSPIIDMEPEDVIEEIIAERRARHG